MKKMLYSVIKGLYIVIKGELGAWALLGLTTLVIWMITLMF